MLRFLSSVWLAVVLIALMALASVFATLYPRVEVFSTFWFRGLLLLFCLNLLVCTLRSLPGVYRRIKKIPSDVNETRAQELDSTIQNSPDDFKEYFRKQGYQVKIDTANGQTNLLAQKGMLNLIAPHLLHLSLIVVLIGGYLSSFGVEDQVTCFVGEKEAVPASVASGMVIEVNDFQTLIDHEGAIDNWVTDFNIYVNDVKATSGTTRVNAPLKYQGVSFYQKSYGYYHLIELIGEQDGVFQIPDKRIFKLGDQTFNITYTNQGPLLRFFQGHDITKEVIVRNGDKLDFPNDTTLTYLQPYPFTVLGVKKDPGTWVVMIGFLLMTIASSLFWTGRYREVAISFRDEKAYLSVHCKSKDIRDEMLTEITQRLRVK
ncbi:MAG: cytochrome c biogenesis protein ResB [Peptococcales bacterium]|jgi:cytochrome c biogenesis protein